MYYGSCKAPRELLWILGVIIFLLMMATAFMGYVLPWGQMSFWGATVITNLFSAIPVVGESITTWLWAASPSTIRRSTASTPCTTCCPSSSWRWWRLYVIALHVHGSNNPLGIDPRGPAGHRAVPSLLHDEGRLRRDGLPDHLCRRHLLRARLHGPSRQLHPGQPAGDARAHRAGMVLPAVLRDPARDSDKLGGVLAMFGAIGVLFVLPSLDTSRVRSATFRPIYKWFMLVLVIDVIVLGLRRQPAGRLLDPAVPARHRLLLLPLPDPAADPGQDRTTVAIAAQHCRRRAQEEGGLIMRKLLVTGAIAAVLATAAVAIAAGTTPHPPHRHWHFQARSAPTTGRRRPARLSGLSRGLRGLSFAVAAGLPQPDGARAEPRTRSRT